MDKQTSCIENMCDSTNAPCECSVCFDLISECDDDAIRLPCFKTHFFHKDCLKKTAYHRRNYNCPLCQKNYNPSIVDNVLDENYSEDHQSNDEYNDDENGAYDEDENGAYDEDDDDSDDEYYDEYYDDDDDDLKYFDKYLEDDMDHLGCVIPCENSYREDYGGIVWFENVDE
jgi:hypothetical protein